MTDIILVVGLAGGLIALISGWLASAQKCSGSQPTWLIWLALSGTVIYGCALLLLLVRQLVVF